ncbi:MAG: gfo/Idh/MocA family oxidoreductase, partial [Verrucomicrobia bacterium]|nr:gfo/Idh/MocA family oxidoreductase [Verrucomicrobiota bacterium]
MKTVSRRAFLKSTTISLAAFGLSPRSWAAVAGANSDVRVAVIGFRSQGAGHVNSLRKLKGVRITALCDVDRRVLESKAKELG